MSGIKFSLQELELTVDTLRKEKLALMTELADVGGGKGEDAHQPSLTPIPYPLPLSFTLFFHP